MSQPFGIEIKTSHMVRVSLGLVAISLLLPGLFQIGPPQWLGDDHDSETIVASRVTEDRASSKASLAVGPSGTPSASIAENSLAGDVSGDLQSESADTAETSENQSSRLADIPSDPLAQSARQHSKSPSSQKGADTHDADTYDSDTQGTVETVMTKSAVQQAEPVAKNASKPATAKAIEASKPDTDQRSTLSGPNTEPVSTDLAMAGKAALRAIAEQPAVRAKVKKAPPAAPEVQTPPKVKASKTAPLVPGVPTRPVYVARNFTKQIPGSHLDLPTKGQKENFVNMVLPLILAANEEISQRRSAIIRAVGRNDRDALLGWARLYRVKGEDKNINELERALLMRADTVPVSLALAQAAIESGWGTSRFARQGNALFGQWAWQADAGLKPQQASNSRAVVRSFPNLFGSVRAYMHNLNTHSSYATFRERRSMMRTRTPGDLGYQLANFMGSYAEIGDVYIDKLQQLIRSNDFGHYEDARLR